MSNIPCSTIFHILFLRTIIKGANKKKKQYLTIGDSVLFEEESYLESILAFFLLWCIKEKDKEMFLGF